MKIGVQVGQVVAGGDDLQRQWIEQLEHFRACRDVGFDFVSWGHHWLIHPFQHFQPIPHGLPGVGAGFTDGVARLMDDPFVIGSPDECLEKLARLHALGATHVALRLFWPGMTQKEALAMIELVAAKLLPTLQRL